MTFYGNLFGKMIWDLNSVIRPSCTKSSVRPNKLGDFCKVDRRLQTRHKWASFHIYKFRLILFQWFLLISFWFYNRILAAIIIHDFIGFYRITVNHDVNPLLRICFLFDGLFKNTWELFGYLFKTSSFLKTISYSIMYLWKYLFICLLTCS